MDALAQKAYEALVGNILPQLTRHFNDLEKIPSQERKISDECSALITEAIELLSLLQSQAEKQSIEQSSNESTKDEIEDAEAMQMLEAMGEPAAEAEEKIQEEMSDAEALKMLEAMDAPVQNGSSENPPKDESKEMSDAEALKMLEAMDAPVQQGTDEQKSDGDSKEMSDADAMKLLEAMDSPSPTTATPKDIDSETATMLEKIDSERAPKEEQDASPAGAVEDSELAFTKEEVIEIEEFGESEFSSDPDMIKDFITNADELMENLDEQILRLEQNPQDSEIINEIFRSAHTIKGAAGMFAFKAMERIMHRMENYFDQISKGKQKVNSDAIDVIFRSMDVLKVLLGGVKEGKPTNTSTVPIVKVLNQLCAGTLEGVQSDSGEKESADKPAQGSKQNKVTQSTIRVDLQRLDALVNLVGELVIDRTRFSNIEEHLRTKGPSNQLAGNMAETVQLFGRHMNEVQDIIMKVRMVPIGNAFNKFSRVVRDLAKNLNKEMELVIEGEHTELDKTIVEQIGDPLIHLIRNAVDHGIEKPEDRVAKGKSAKGKITLSARQEGNQIMITIEDDGKGMDREIIRQKGVEKGLITEDENLSDRDVFNLIFEPGFSTAEQVTNISGRGVGMDVVKKKISKLKGIIDISSAPNKGSVLSIQLPLTLAIVQSLLVKTREEIFAIPLSAVVESIRIRPKDIQNVGDSEVIKRRNRVLPLLYLHEALDLDKKESRFWYGLPNQTEGSSKRNRKRQDLSEDRLFVVVVGTAERRFGLVVDNLLNQQEMVIKSMGNLMTDIPCLAGGAILGNGEVVLVLDIGELEDHFRSKSRQQQVA